MRLLNFVITIAIVFVGSNAAPAGSPRQEIPPSQEAANKGYFDFYFENDALGDRDRDYSNGLRFAWISGDFGLEELDYLQPFARPVSSGGGFLKSILGFRDPGKIRFNYGVSLTQLIYTPDDRDSFSQPADERRYAGWSALGFSLHAKDERVLNSLEFSLGTTGENSQAEHTQDLFHDLIGAKKFNGWEEQIPNEITADLSFVQKRRVDFLDFERGSFRLDGLTEWGARLGGFRTDAHAGAFIRAGYNLPPDFSDPRISTTAYTHRYVGDGEDYVGNWSFYGLAGVNGYGVGHDATLDGPLFRDFETGNDREPWVGEVFCGVGLRYRRVELSYVQTWRSDEYEEQANTGSFGSLALRVRF